MPVDCYVGAQFGSEGKGAVVARVADRYAAAVRTGAPNAGHSLWYDGKLYKMRSIPCAWVNPECELIIGPGGLINPDILSSELNELPGRVAGKLFVNPQAGVIAEEDIEEEEKVGMNARIGSTAEGVGPAAARKLLRRGSTLAKDVDWLSPCIDDTTKRLHKHLKDGRSVMLEGTQGTGLSLHHGHYPFVTSRDVTAAALMSDAGVPPGELRHVFLVMRVYPIRVAGNSGPMGAGEISWSEVSRRCGAPDGAIVEKTTVTQRIRRVSELSWTELERAVMLNKPTGIFITFMDYISWAMHGATFAVDLTEDAIKFIKDVEAKLDVPVVAVCTGPKPEHQIWLRPVDGLTK